MFFGATAFAEAPFSAEGLINAQVQVTGVEAITAISSVSIQAGGNIYVASGTEVELQSTVNIVSVTANADVILNTNSLTIALGNEQTTADANVTVSTNLLTTALGNEQTTADADVTVSTNLLTTALGNEQTTADANVTVSTNLLSIVEGNATVELGNQIFAVGIDLNTTTGTLNVSTDVNIIVDGLDMIARTKTPFIYAWVVVNTNTTGNWRVVDIAA